MAHWSGFTPTPPSGPSLRQWVGLTDSFTFPDDSEELMESRWWEAGPACGLTFEPINCHGARCEDFKCDVCVTPGVEEECDCNPDDCGDECAEDYPEAVAFYPFWVKKSYETCELRNQARVRQRLESEMDQNTWAAIASKLWVELGRFAESVGDSPVCAPEAVGVLSQARSDVGGGIFLAPGYALSRLESDGQAKVGPDGRYRIGGRPLIVDDSFGTSGPGGTAAPAGAAYVYHIDQLPIVSARPPIYSNPKPKPGCGPACCELHEIKRQAITAFNTCRSYAALIQVAC